MTTGGIRKGHNWGARGQLPPSAPIATSDVEAAALIGGKHRVIGLESGDLARTLGIRKPFTRAREHQLVPIDGLHVDFDDGSSVVAIAHVLIGRLAVDRHVIAVMNAAFVGNRNVAPRAHPGDGKADVVSMDLSRSDRLKARSRMITGTHVPHPGISIRKVDAAGFDLGRSRLVTIDGRRCGRRSWVGFKVLPGAIIVAVS